MCFFLYFLFFTPSNVIRYWTGKLGHSTQSCGGNPFPSTFSPGPNHNSQHFAPCFPCFFLLLFFMAAPAVAGEWGLQARWFLHVPRTFGGLCCVLGRPPDALWPKLSSARKSGRKKREQEPPASNKRRCARTRNVFALVFVFYCTRTKTHKHTHSVTTLSLCARPTIVFKILCVQSICRQSQVHGIFYIV